MKNPKLIGLLIFTITVLFTIITTGCNNTEKAIIGKWRTNHAGVDLAYDFKTNNEVDVFMYKDFGEDFGLVEELIYIGKYDMVGNKIELTLSGNKEAVYFTSYITDEEIGALEYKIKGNTLILSDDGISETIFIKMK
jgi:hypothetical protein